MAGNDDSYIAWDGSRYQGSPPPDWYLAADNRWWPSQDLIDSRGRTASGDREVRRSRSTGGDSAAPNSTRPPAARAQPPAPVAPRPVPAPSITPSWAPQSGSSWSPGRPTPAGNPGLQPPPPQPPPRPISPLPGGNAGAGVPTSVGPPTTTPAATTTSAPPLRRRRRRGKAGPGLLIPILVFLLFRCGVDSSAVVDPDFRPLPTVAPTTTSSLEAIEDEATAVPTSPATTGLPAGTPADRSVFSEGDLELRVTGCGPGTLTAGATNVGPTAATFEVTVEIADRTAGTPDRQIILVDRTIGPLEPDESEPLIIPLEGALTDSQSCVLVAVSLRD